MKESLPVIIAVLLTAGCTSIHRLDSSKYQVISVPQDLRDATGVDDSWQRLTNGTPFILKVSNGERMPLKLMVDLPMGELEKGDCAFVFKRDTYLFLSQKGCMLSPDGQRWASVAAPKSVAKLFGAKHGDFRFGFSTGTNYQSSMILLLQAK
jgi:uncharacterized protein YceK